jgi:hypothetical protein
MYFVGRFGGEYGICLGAQIQEDGLRKCKGMSAGREGRI